MKQTISNDMVRRAPISLEVKASESGRIEGYASTFGGEPDRHGDVVQPGAFTDSLNRHKAAGEMPVMLWAHAIEQPIGRWENMEPDSKGLFVRGSLNLKTTKGPEAFEHVKAGDLGGLSIGYTIPKDGTEYVGEGTYNLKKIDLLEVSIVAIPADPFARITGVKSLKSKAEAIDMLRECGLSKAAAGRFAAGGFKALGDDETHEKSMKLAEKIDAAIKKMRTV